MDKLLRRIGLSGRSIVPMLIGFGCTVPGVMASRTLPSERDRKMTILLTPFMSCSAKLPIYSLFAVTFFPDHAALVMVGLYFLGIIVGILAAFALKGTLFRGEAVPFVMELPNYRLPGLKNVCQLLWEKARDFLERAFTVIFIATIVIWFLQNFDLQLSLTADPQESILALVASCIAPLFAAGLRGLAGVHGADHRLHGQGERGFDPDHSVWFLGCAGGSAFPGGSGSPAGVLLAVHPLHCGGGFRQTGTGQTLGGRHGAESVCCGVGRGPDRAAHRTGGPLNETLI